jgi:putative adhesin
MFRRIALFVAVSLAGIAGARGEEWSKMFPVAGRADLRVDAKDGAVTVRAWDQKTISARVSAVGWKIGPDELDIQDHQMGDHVELVLKMPSAHWGFGRRSIDVEVKVPRDTRLDLRTGDGAIRVFDVAGEIRLVTGDGAIEAAGVEGSVQARTGDGRIGVRGRLESLNLHTGDGSVRAEILPGSRLASGWRIETGDGSVTVRVPSDLAADLDLHTGDGHLTVDLPLTADRRDRKTVRGKLNGGGPAFAIRTGDGSVAVKAM